MSEVVGVTLILLGLVGLFAWTFVLPTLGLAWPLGWLA